MNLWHIGTAYRVSQHCCCHVDLLWPKQSTTRMQEGDAHFKKKTRFLHVSQAKDLHGHFELTFLFQLHHLEPLMTLFGRFNKVEARCETSGPKMLRKHVSLDLHLVKLMAFYITSWQAIASTPREQKIGYKSAKPITLGGLLHGPHLINQASNLPINSKKVAKKGTKTTTTQQRLQDPAQTTLMT